MFRDKNHKGIPVVLTLCALLALAAFFSACSSKSKTEEATPEAPEVTAFEPEGDATGVGVAGAAITATFSVDMDASTIDEDTFYVKDADGTAVAGTISVGTLEGETGKRLAVFTPSAALAGMMKYTATLTTGVKSADGVALAEDKSWSFTTGSLPILAAAANTTCATKSDGLLYCWGANEDGEVGDETVVAKSVPTKVSGSFADWVALSGAAAGDHFCGIRAGGTLWCWGDNEKGQLGLNASGVGAKKTKPTQVGTDSDWAAVSCGMGHTCAIRTSGKLYCWGDNTAGQLGDGTKDARLVPWQVGTASDWKVVAPGLAHTCAAKGSDYDLYCWGDNSGGQLGDGTKDEKPSPTKTSSIAGWVSLGAGWVHTCGIKSDGDIYCWGGNAAGQLGLGDDTIAEELEPTKAKGGGWTSLSSDLGHNCAMKSDGALYCWGYNEWGQLGDGAKANKFEPIKISSDADWRDVTTGGGHGCARKTDGELYCWGENSDGQLGDGTTTESLLPKKISGFK